MCGDVCVCLWLWMCIYICMYICVLVWIHLSVCHVCVYVCVGVVRCVYWLYMCLCVYVCIFVFIHLSIYLPLNLYFFLSNFLVASFLSLYSPKQELLHTFENIVSLNKFRWPSNQKYMPNTKNTRGMMPVTVITKFMSAQLLPFKNSPALKKCF